jgi:hypothetical protein
MNPIAAFALVYCAGVVVIWLFCKFTAGTPEAPKPTSTLRQRQLDVIAERDRLRGPGS